jgi:hypothetical protein
VITCPSAFVMSEANVYHTGQESPGREHDCTSPELQSELCNNTNDCVTLQQKVIYCLLEQPEVRLVLEETPYRIPIEHAICLCAGCANRWAFTRVKNAKLNAGLIRSRGHHAAQRVYLFDKMPFSDAANRWIAGHLAQSLDAVGQQQDSAAHPSGSKGRFGTGMSAADHNDVDFLRKMHSRRYRKGANHTVTGMV